MSDRPPEDPLSDRQPFSAVALVLMFYVPLAIALLAIMIAVAVISRHTLPWWVWSAVGLIFFVPPTVLALALRRTRHNER